MIDTKDMIQTVREGLDAPDSYVPRKKGHLALDSLAAELERLSYVEGRLGDFAKVAEQDRAELERVKQENELLNALDEIEPVAELRAQLEQMKIALRTEHGDHLAEQLDHRLTQDRLDKALALARDAKPYMQGAMAFAWLERLAEIEGARE